MINADAENIKIIDLLQENASLEGDDVDIFADGKANWPFMKAGFEEMRARFPRSDFVLNIYAKFACIAGDKFTYGNLRPLMNGHVSASAWSEQVSIEKCNRKSISGDMHSISR